jgi:AraC-like DNA-binding protein
MTTVAATRFESRAWLTSPLATAAGTLHLAGCLRNARNLDPAAMRVLGRYGLAYLVAGEGYYRDARGADRGLTPGDLVVVFPDVPHAYGGRDGTIWDQVYFIFDGPQFDLWRKAGLLSPARPVWRLEPVDYWHRRLAEVVPAGGRRSPAAAVGALGRFVHVLADMFEADAQATADPAHEVWLSRSQQLLGERTATGWLTPQQVARQVGLSYGNFRKRFAAQTGQSPGQFRKRCRIDQACAAIFQGRQSFKEIAAELDFCDVFHFSKAFRQLAGLSPSEFRRKVCGR